MHKCASSGFSNSLFSVLLLLAIGCVLSTNVKQREECILGNVVYKFDIGTVSPICCPVSLLGSLMEELLQYPAKITSIRTSE